MPPATLTTSPHTQMAVEAQSDPNLRRSSRTKRSRTMSINGFTVLVANNYSLDEGVKTMSGSNLANALRALPPVQGARSAFIMFCAHNRERLVRPHTPMGDAQRILAAA